MAKHIVIVGNGITGVTAARFIRKLSGYRITIISAETDHFYARTALMYIYMGHMRYRDTKPYEDSFWSKNRIDLIRGYVTSINLNARTIEVDGSKPVSYDTLLLATGSRSNKFGWPGQDLPGVQGLYGMQDLAAMELATRGVDQAVVVGGGLIGIEMAEMLHARGIPVTFLVREHAYMSRVLPSEESALIGDEIVAHGIDLRLATELKAVLPNEEGKVGAVITSDSEKIPCQFVGLTVGVHPNIDLARAAGIATQRGILVNEFFETSEPGVFAAGDCAEFTRDGIGSRRVEQLWYTGRKHGRTVANTICGTPTAYNPGYFFNSAKFFGLEYQTYGTVAPVRPANVGTRLWQDVKLRKLLRINYNDRVLGFNALGIRLRHDVCEKWIKEGATIEYVTLNLRRALFDGEFTVDRTKKLALAYA